MNSLVSLNLLPRWKPETLQSPPVSLSRRSYLSFRVEVECCMLHSRGRLGGMRKVRTLVILGV